jgi:hypothetical protein
MESPMPTQAEIEALDRLFKIAKDGTADSRRVADFLLTWWDAGRNGGFDLTAMWSLDEEIRRDLVIAFDLIGREHSYPDDWGYVPGIREVIQRWRPEWVAEVNARYSLSRG